MLETFHLVGAKLLILQSISKKELCAAYYFHCLTCLNIETSGSL